MARPGIEVSLIFKKFLEGLRGEVYLKFFSGQLNLMEQYYRKRKLTLAQQR
jgi:hypothetical protein